MHRLSRQSPFDSSGRLQTSFAAVTVTPLVAPQETAIEIHERDLRTDFFRASGPGGQNVNKRDTAVRLTHLPTGVVTRCQIERSQQRNRQLALQQLAAKLTAMREAEKDAERRSRFNARGPIAWGRHIRSYVPGQDRVKDHRTGIEANAHAVFKGMIEPFLEGDPPA